MVQTLQQQYIRFLIDADSARQSEPSRLMALVLGRHVHSPADTRSTAVRLPTRAGLFLSRLSRVVATIQTYLNMCCAAALGLRRLGLNEPPGLPSGSSSVNDLPGTVAVRRPQKHFREANIEFTLQL